MEAVVSSSFIFAAGGVTDVSNVPGEDFSGISDERESLVIQEEVY
jgi:hypothetical protein